MADAILLFPPGFQVTNASGVVQASAKLKFYDAGTTNSRQVYSDPDLSTSLGTGVICNSAGRPSSSGNEVLVYASEGNLKIEALTSASASLWSFDDVIGALDTTGFSAQSALPNTPVLTKTGSYTIVDGDEGSVINFNVSGEVTATLPSAVTVGDGWRITIRNIHASGNVNIITVGGQTVDGETSQNLVKQYEGLCLVSDAANWHIDGHAKPIPTGQLPVFFIKDRDLATAPTGGSPGDRYIMAGNGGSWSGFSNPTDGIVENDGQGGWIDYTPQEGWLAYLEDENRMVQYDGTRWWHSMGGMALLVSDSVTTEAAISIDLSSYTGFRGFVIELYNARSSANDDLIRLRFSTNSGSSFATAGYSWNGVLVNSAGANFSGKGVEADQEILIATDRNLSTAAGHAFNATVKLIGADSETLWSRAIFESGGISTSTQGFDVHGTGQLKTAQNTDAVQFSFETGTITASYVVYGLL